MPNWLINGSNKWIIDPFLNKWKFGNPGDGCCFRRAIKCPDNSDTTLWMTTTTFGPIQAFKYQNVCYKPGPHVAGCVSPGGTLLTAGQVQIFSSCTTCLNQPQQCIPCMGNFLFPRVVLAGMTGKFAEPYNGIHDLAFSIGDPVACSWNKSVSLLCPDLNPNPFPGGIGVTMFNQGTNVNGHPNTSVTLSIGFSGTAIYTGYLPPSAVTDFCEGTPLLMNLEPIVNGTAPCYPLTPASATIFKV